jgi:hypothetical protein
MDISENIDVISDISIRITEIVDEHNMVDWQTNKDIHNKIAQDIDDMFYEIEKEKGNKNQNKCPKILTTFIPFKEVKPFLFFIKAIVRICLLSK